MDERYGTDAELRQFIAKAQRMGYQVVCHTVSCGAYEIADNFDRDLLTKKRDENGDLAPYIREHYKRMVSMEASLIRFVQNRL